ncbi:hypothetical protein ACEN9X_09605 [Mucilaginibacter sp. Mucisp86]|uniref:hypothetical protein n=1 Tax=Mucilaginibacter sp. Mucisp86 TaxID=3243060 RepID=UPI0039B528C2
MKALKRFVKLLWDFIWHIVVVLLLLLFGFHLWFIRHSESAIDELITWSSKGKVKCTLHRVSINYLSNDLDVKDIVFFNTDSVQQATSYRFSTQDFHLKIHSKWDLLFHKRLVIDAVTFNAPDITVTRKANVQQTVSGPRIALTREIGNLYRTILRSLRVLNLRLFEIKDGRLQLNDAGANASQPLKISHINFTINELQIDSASLKNKSRFVFSEQVRLRITDQHIALPGNHGSVGFKELLINTRDKFIRITSPDIQILPSKGGRNRLAFFANKIGVTGLDFNALYQRQFIKADSVFLDGLTSNYDIFGDTPKKQTGLKVAPLNGLLTKSPLSFNISHIVMSKGNAAIHLHLAGKVTSFSTRNDDISISGFHLNDSTQKGLTIKGFNYTVRNYVGYTPDSLLRFGFDSLQFVDSKIVLYNLAAATDRRAGTGLQQTYTVPRFEITGMDWLSFIFRNKFKARSAALYNPVIRLIKNDGGISDPDRGKTDGRSIYQNLSLLHKVLSLDQLRIVHGDLAYQNAGKFQLHVKNLGLDVHAGQLEKAGSPDQLMRSLNSLSFENVAATVDGTGMNVDQGAWNGREKQFSFSKLRMAADSGHTRVALSGVLLNAVSFESDRLKINGISWKDGNLQVNAGHESRANDSSRKSPPGVWVDHISGKNTRLSFANKTLNAEAYIQTISGQHFRKEPGKPLELENLLIGGSDLLLNSGAGQLKCTNFFLRDGENSMLKNVSIQQQRPGDSLLVRIPELSFKPFIKRSLESQKITIGKISVNRPEIIYSSKSVSRQSGEKSPSVTFPGLLLTGIGINDASVRLRQNSSVIKIADLSLKINRIATRADDAVSVDQVQINTRGLLVMPDNKQAIKAAGALSAGFHSILFHPVTKAWEIQLDKFLTDSMSYLNTHAGHGTVSLSADHLHVSGVRATSDDLKHWLPWLADHSRATISLGALRWQTVGNNLTARDITFSQNERHASIGSLSLDPRKNREEFYKQLIYRKDYIRLGSGAITLDGLGTTGGQLHIADMDIKNPVLSIFSNKLKKPGSESEQPLPIAALGSIPMPLQVEKLQVENAKIGYTELNEVSRDTGQVYFTAINALISNVATRWDAATDSLRVAVKANFLDQMPLNLNMAQSYHDDKGGLALHMQLGRGKAALLNGFLAPLVSMQARSGYVDTMYMSAAGNEYLTSGRMHLNFHGLRANILDSGNVKHQKFSTKLVTFLFNTFALKSHNQNKGADFYFVRDRDGSTIDYFLQMVVEGAAGSTVPLTRHIYRKEYKKALEAMALSAKKLH